MIVLITDAECVYCAVRTQYLLYIFQVYLSIQRLRATLLSSHPFHFRWLISCKEKNEMGGACSANGEGRGVYRVLVGKPEGRRPLGRPRRRWDDNIKMDLQDVGYGGYGLDRAGSG